MNIVRLMVLGVIMLEGRPTHGYGVRKKLVDWHADSWTDIKPGSIYHALKQLGKQGLLDPLGTQASAQGPGRERYWLTEAGRAEFFRLHDEALMSVNFLALSAAIAFMQTRPRAHVIALLEKQAEAARTTGARLTAMQDDFPERNQPPHTADLLSLSGGVVTSVAGWTQAMIARLRSGEYRMADD